jgi:hypothetical protein
MPEQKIVTQTNFLLFRRVAHRLSYSYAVWNSLFWSTYFAFNVINLHLAFIMFHKILLLLLAFVLRIQKVYDSTIGEDSDYVQYISTVYRALWVKTRGVLCPSWKLSYVIRDYKTCVSDTTMLNKRKKNTSKFCHVCTPIITHTHTHTHTYIYIQ